MSSHRKNPKEAWLKCRRAFERRASVAAEFTAMLHLIDHATSHDWSKCLHASISLDNLVLRANGRMAVVISKPRAVHFQLYEEGKLVEQIEVGPDHIGEEVDRLVPKLLPKGEPGAHTDMPPE